jgi:hypothetical protein
MNFGRVVPLLIIGALTICLGLVGFPWQTPEVLGNFSGRVVYASGNGNLDLKGHFNLFNCPEPPSCIRVRVLWDGQVHDIEVDRSNGTFTGRVKMAALSGAEVETRLEVDGRIVARGVIAIPSSLHSGVHIIRFSSLS